MSNDYVAMSKEQDERAVALFKGAPDYWRARRQAGDAAFADGALDAATKELLALVIGVVMRCEACVVHHAKLSHKKGVTREQLAEAMAVAAQMGGGPAMAYGAEALAAYDQFAAEGK
jgi:AhpD family alkylhydroperoxidase